MVKSKSAFDYVLTMSRFFDNHTRIALRDVPFIFDDLKHFKSARAEGPPISLKLFVSRPLVDLFYSAVNRRLKTIVYGLHATLAKRMLKIFL